ncbi:hypothetical protein MTR67_053089 [Solanum verrucosum]|uniref:Uncharacterized protein n=1 Tax=Solanum verrucosum TaxID=315347 RepID=A0AAF1A406_SOLVR|nr:hypothetical protein MTR67_053089 [Solanum verrucosum]
MTQMAKRPGKDCQFYDKSDAWWSALITMLQAIQQVKSSVVDIVSE